jgi:hypothetical protein
VLDRHGAFLLPENPIKVKLESKKLDAFASTPTMLLKAELLIDFVGRRIEANAKRLIVEQDIIDTGTTLNSTLSRRVPGARLARRIGPTTDYAAHLEFGTVRMPARPFMIPALEAERRPFIAAVGKLYR